MVQLIFTDQYANLLFLVNGLAVLFYIGAKKKKRQRAMKFGNYETLQKVAGKNFLKSSNVILIARLLALTALIIGISNPVIVREVPSTNADYVLAIDSSGSMLADDFEPNRLAAAKEVSRQFVNRLSDTVEIGVISFSGAVKKEQAITSDKEDVRDGISGIRMGQTAGTAIGDAIFTGSSMLMDSNRTRRLVLVTDGRNNVGSSLNESVRFANRQNVTVTAIGIGKQESESGGSNTRFGTIDGQNATRAEFPNLDVEKLNRTVQRTGGRLITVTDRAELESAFLSFKTSKQRTDISLYFILLALGLMLGEWILGTTRYSILP
ncbi:MAG: VWA domain-containing protein [Candidatus Nanohaloarchaea archaeon]